MRNMASLLATFLIVSPMGLFNFSSKFLPIFHRFDLDSIFEEKLWIFIIFFASNFFSHFFWWTLIIATSCCQTVIFLALNRDTNQSRDASSMSITVDYLTILPKKYIIRVWKLLHLAYFWALIRTKQYYLLKKEIYNTF